MKNKILLIIFGIFSVLISMEIILRLSGFFYHKEWMRKEFDFVKSEEERAGLEVIDKQRPLMEDKGLIKIMCVGDSHTFGFGVRPGYSYPAQLQRLLDERDSRKYRVYNCGLPGLTAFKLLRYLPELVKRYEPNIVIVLIGTNDISYLEPSDLFLVSKGFRRYWHSIKYLVKDLRTYKVIRFGLGSISEKSKIKNSKISELSSINKDANVNPKSKKYAQIGLDLYRQGKIELAKIYLERAINIDQSIEEAYLTLGDLYKSLNEFDKMLFIFGQLLTVNPYTFKRAQIYRELYFVHQIPNSPQGKIEAFLKSIPSDETFFNPGMIPFEFDRKERVEIFEKNLQKIVDFIKANNGQPILQTYLDVGLSESDSVIKNLSKKKNIILVDNLEKFQQLMLLNNLSPSYYLNKDWHPNNKGYYIMARNLYDAIIAIDRF